MCTHRTAHKSGSFFDTLVPLSGTGSSIFPSEERSLNPVLKKNLCDGLLVKITDPGHPPCDPPVLLSPKSMIRAIRRKIGSHLLRKAAQRHSGEIQEVQPGREAGLSPHRPNH